MYAKVENNQVVKVNSSLASFNNAAPSWSAEQLAANGIHEVVYNHSNLKDERFYINGAESFDFANDTVTASHSAATGKALDDVNATDENDVELDPVVVISGVKTNEKKMEIENMKAENTKTQTMKTKESYTPMRSPDDVSLATQTMDDSALLLISG